VAFVNRTRLIHGATHTQSSANRAVKGSEQEMLKATVVVTIACAGIIPVGGVTGHAQVTQGSKVVVASEASVESVSLKHQNVDSAPFALRAVKGGTPALRLAIPFDGVSQPSRSNRSRAAARSKKRIIAGAIVGSVGGFFAGGFLGAHIEGDRCNCDDPGVRGFLIGAPIGAVAGGIVAAKFLF
jgi:hypothetical protein